MDDSKESNEPNHDQADPCPGISEDLRRAASKLADGLKDLGSAARRAARESFATRGVRSASDEKSEKADASAKDEWNRKDEPPPAGDSCSGTPGGRKQRFERTVREHPVGAVLLAAAAGFLLAGILRR